MSLSHPDQVELKDQTALQASSSHEEIIEMIDPKLERRLKWKLDLFILPLISSVYFFASMVRHMRLTLWTVLVTCSMIP